MDARFYVSASGSEIQEGKSDASIGPDDEGKKEEELESRKAEMIEVREENARLRTMLNQIEKNYRSLQMRFIDVFQQQSKVKINPSISREDTEEPDLVSLRLGRRNPGESKQDENITSSCKTREDEKLKREDLKLGLDYNKLQDSKSDGAELGSNPSHENSLEEITKQERVAGETWPPSKAVKTMRSGEDELSEQSSVKRARVSVRARCDAPTMNDGCQWRKYGQKIAKGNPCPRAYYRCTVAPACPVRKQVQRCAEDMSILITTYEGTHNHPLPVSATAMASTTSAAASMLISGSSSSAATASFATNLQGLNFTVSDYSKTRPFYLPNSSSSHPFPTITLDLTSSSSSSSSTHFNNILSSSSRFPWTSLSFSSSEPNISPAVWGNGHLNYGSLLPYNKSNIGSFNLGRPSQDQGNYQPNYTDKNNQASSPSQQFLTETLTRAITSDPSFRSVIAAAISSMAGDGGGNQGNHGRGESFGQNLSRTRFKPLIPIL